MAQNSSPGPTWYDILGVSPQATPEQVKAAWRDATDKFEPGTGASQFRLFNEAADVLLHPEKRAAYDAELGLATLPDPSVETVAEPGPPLASPPPPPPPPTPAPPSDAEPATVVEPASGTAAPASGIPTAVWVVSVISVLAVASLVVAAIFGIRLEHRVQTRKDDASSSAEASAVAERALNVVFSYDYRHMDADRDRSVKFLTPKYRKSFEKTFKLLTEGPDGTPGPALKTKAVIRATVLSAAVQDASPDEVRVLAFVNQTATRNGADPRIFQNRVVATMVRHGDDWLIDDVDSY